MAPVPQPQPASATAVFQSLKQFFKDYFWFLAKNVIGWILILSSPVLGLAVPGPGGLPLFLIGFALVSFPGKRRLTARVMRGRQLRIQAKLFSRIAAFFSVVVPLIVLWVVVHRYGETIQGWKHGILALIGVCVVSVGLSWLLARLAFRMLNVLLQWMPVVRRKARPWLRRQGIHLLPPRRRREKARPGLVETTPAASVEDEEILVIHERHHRRLWAAWEFAKPWLHRAVVLGFTIAIFVWMLQPLAQRFWLVNDAVLATSPLRFLLAASLFALYVLIFRVLAWQQILRRLGQRAPLKVLTRVWVVSELIRYLPGTLGQMAGRAHLLKYHRVDEHACLVSQAYELTIAVIANLFIAGVGIIGAGFVMADLRLADIDPYLLVGGVLLVIVLVMLNSSILPRFVHQFLRLHGEPQTRLRLRYRVTVGLFFWMVLGLVCQALIFWLLLNQQNTLNLQFNQLWIVAAAYSLAWAAGTLVLLTPQGLGVRELVFVKTLELAKGPFFAPSLPSPEALLAFLSFVAILLRLLIFTGMIILGAVVTAVDYRRLAGAPGNPPPRPSGLSETGAVK